MPQQRLILGAAVGSPIVCRKKVGKLLTEGGLSRFVQFGKRHLRRTKIRLEKLDHIGRRHIEPEDDLDALLETEAILRDPVMMRQLAQARADKRAGRTRRIRSARELV